MKISIVIPVLNEEAHIKSILDMTEQMPGEKEIIVVDGGSKDKTVELAKASKAVVINSPKGRAKQMNAGAKIATGEVIFFLHSDSKIGKQALLSIDWALQDPNIVGGGFTLEIDDSRFIFKLVALGSNIRPKLSKVFFGDQGIFVRRTVFEAIGGYPDIVLMEDWEISRSLKKKGRLVQLPDKIVTSARRWQKTGTWKTILLMHKLKLFYKFGVSPEALKKMYYDAR